jgi:hypothetical protein
MPAQVGEKKDALFGTQAAGKGTCGRLREKYKGERATAAIAAFELRFALA